MASVVVVNHNKRRHVYLTDEYITCIIVLNLPIFTDWLVPIVDLCIHVYIFNTKPDGYIAELALGFIIQIGINLLNNKELPF